jgi:hypothetical protein
VKNPTRFFPTHPSLEWREYRALLTALQVEFDAALSAYVFFVSSKRNPGWINQRLQELYKTPSQVIADYLEGKYLSKYKNGTLVPDVFAYVADMATGIRATLAGAARVELPAIKLSWTGGGDGDMFGGIIHIWGDASLELVDDDKVGVRYRGWVNEKGQADTWFGGAPAKDFIVYRAPPGYRIEALVAGSTSDGFDFERDSDGPAKKCGRSPTARDSFGWSEATATRSNERDRVWLHSLQIDLEGVKVSSRPSSAPILAGPGG